jgi:hypothetical protein
MGLLYFYYLGVQTKKYETGGARGANEGEVRCIHGFGEETGVKRVHLEGLSISGIIIFKWI